MFTIAFIFLFLLFKPCKLSECDKSIETCVSKYFETRKNFTIPSYDEPFEIYHREEYQRYIAYDIDEVTSYNFHAKNPSMNIRFGCEPPSFFKKGDIIKICVPEYSPWWKPIDCAVIRVENGYTLQTTCYPQEEVFSD